MADASKENPRVTFFAMREEGDGFEASMSKLMAQLISQKVGERIPVENHQAYTHGRSWTHPANEFAYPGQMQTQSAEVVTPFQDIVNGDFEIVPRMVKSLVKQFDEASARMLYQTMTEMCDATGQSVDARDIPFPEAFMEGFRKIRFGVDRDGNVSMPEIHVGNPKMIEQLQAMPDEFHEEIARLQEEKIAQAKAEEANRRAKFKRGRE